MRTPSNKTVAVTWSGGIDSTAVLGKLLEAGYTVIPVAMNMGPYHFMKNEHRAREEISAYFRKIYPSQWNDPEEVNAKFLTLFSHDGGKEILRRNKHILDYVMTNFVIPGDLYYVATGSHLGSYPPAIDHLPGGDTDSREMIAYMLAEYGIGYQLITLLDFGPSRYKLDRVSLLCDILPKAWRFLTYNCLATNVPLIHCGRCYKCVERHAAFETHLGRDGDDTEYQMPPKDSGFYEGYLRHFEGNSPQLSWKDICEPDMGSHAMEGGE